MRHFALLVLMSIGLGYAYGQTKAPATEPARQVLAVYFHGTIRCVECLKIEQESRHILEQTFTNALAIGQLKWQSINYDLPEHAENLQKYRLPCPSLVLILRTNGVDARWKLLGETWKFIEEPVHFRTYIIKEVKDYLETRP